MNVSGQSQTLPVKWECPDCSMENYDLTYLHDLVLTRDEDCVSIYHVTKCINCHEDYNVLLVRKAKVCKNVSG